jgi:alpha-tubulin suppressor-like RCC1 family protein
LVSTYDFNTAEVTLANIHSKEIGSVALDSLGQAWAWGPASNGILGNNDATNAKSFPVSVHQGTLTFTQINTGASNRHSLAIDTNGQAWAWGHNNGGQLGNNAVLAVSLPVSVHQGALTFTQIRSENFSSLALDTNGKAWAWGSGGSGRLGNNSIVSTSVPVSVHQGALTFTQISAGSFYSLALDSLGQVWGWGTNDVGQLGTNNLASTSVPVSVHQGALTFTQISTSNNHSLALDSLGQVWAWGANNAGKLGNNSIASVSVPVSVHQGALTFTQISAGIPHSLALDTNGKAWAWGSNADGLLGNTLPSSVSASIPVAVSQGLTIAFTQLTAGSVHNLALDATGQLWAWGSNTNNSLGIAHFNTIKYGLPTVRYPVRVNSKFLNSPSKASKLQVIQVTPSATYSVVNNDGYLSFGNTEVGQGNAIVIAWF